MSEIVKFALQTTLVISIIIFFTCDFFRSDRKLYLIPYFYVKPNIRNNKELFFPTNEATLIELSKFVAIVMEKVSVKIVFFQMIEINYVPIYMKINQIFFVIQGQFPVMDFMPKLDYVHCIYVLCIFYCKTCMH